jgi:hypothetical protein
MRSSVSIRALLGLGEIPCLPSARSNRRRKREGTAYQYSCQSSRSVGIGYRSNSLDTVLDGQLETKGDHEGTG